MLYHVPAYPLIGFSQLSVTLCSRSQENSSLCFCLWKDALIPLDIDNLPKYKVDKKEFVCEISDRWTAEDTDCFYYDILDHDEEEDKDSEIDSWLCSWTDKTQY